MDATFFIREATPGDIPAILAIYNDAVRETTAIWNDVIVDFDNRRRWMEERQARAYPVLVAERDGRAVGYASYGDWRPHDGYRHTREHSIYVDSANRGRGIGKALLAALIDAARAQGVHVLIGCIEAENTGSIALHRSLGFREVGTFREVGQKFGRWLDLACLELVLE
nr:N-acetyltransferase family protein [uncultured Gellertiella sp.]